ncbi:MAG: 2,3,4,5-tetrahydropyridine-2,6-dicarboxylate N-succinyltransferase, partial [Acidobacteria bacterium]
MSGHEDLKAAIERLAGERRPDLRSAREAVERLLDLLEEGRVRAATPDGSGGWTVHPWVKKGLLLAFRVSKDLRYPPAGPLGSRDKDLLPPRGIGTMPGVRLVPGGSAVRRGAHVGPGTVLMPPCYVNTGAYVGRGAMIDSHALVGSCAQIGDRVHLAAGAQIGGVLEPPGAAPVIVEEDCFVGALAGLFEGVRVRRGAVIGAGVVLTASTPLYDLGEERILRAGSDGVLSVPERAVVVAA